MQGAVYFHRGSPFMAKVYAKQKEVARMDKAQAQKDGKMHRQVRFQMINGIPCDIWMTTMSPASDPLKEFTEDWSVINQAVLNKAGRMRSPKTFLLGISLKKLGNTVTLKEFNQPTRTKEITHTLKVLLLEETMTSFLVLICILK